jgi:hypothetical protein
VSSKYVLNYEQNFSYFDPDCPTTGLAMVYCRYYCYYYYYHYRDAKHCDCSQCQEVFPHIVKRAANPISIEGGAPVCEAVGQEKRRVVGG